MTWGQRIAWFRLAGRLKVWPWQIPFYARVMGRVTQEDIDWATNVSKAHRWIEETPESC